MTVSPRDVAALATDVRNTELKYLLHGPRHDPITTPWMPYQPADFIGILWECLPEIDIPQPQSFLTRKPTFLDVGCGPGTKMDIAEQLFGLCSYGIEIDKEMAEIAARKYPLRAVQGDALEYEGYAGYDIIWLYRPFRDIDKERELESRIISAMKPGAILAGGSWETDVPALGWTPVVDDTLTNPMGPGCIWRGAWQKPKERK